MACRTVGEEKNKAPDEGPANQVSCGATPESRRRESGREAGVGTGVAATHSIANSLRGIAVPHRSAAS